jgi:hypothetical protein
VDTNTTDEWPDPDRSDDDVSPPSAFPGAGRRVSDEERLAALEAEPVGNAEVGDTVDTDEVDSSAHAGTD